MTSPTKWRPGSSDACTSHERQVPSPSRSSMAVRYLPDYSKRQRSRGAFRSPRLLAQMTAVDRDEMVSTHPPQL